MSSKVALVAVTMAEKMFMKLRTARRRTQQITVTEEALLEMAAVCRKHGASFVVALLACDENVKHHYREFLRKNDVQVIDCVYPVTPQMMSSDGLHPNGRLNSLYAEKITRAIKGRD